MHCFSPESAMLIGKNDISKNLRVCPFITTLSKTVLYCYTKLLLLSHWVLWQGYDVAFAMVLKSSLINPIPGREMGEAVWSTTYFDSK